MKPKKERNRGEDIAENLRAAASMCGVSLEAVKLAKAMGCDAFLAGSRIHIPKLAAFLASDEFKNESKQAATSEDWQERLTKAKALREELRLAKEKGELWESETVRRAYTVGDEAMMSTLRRWLESDLPPLIEGKGAGEILAANVKFLDELTAQLRADREAAVAAIAEASGQGEAPAEDEEGKA